MIRTEKQSTASVAADQLRGYVERILRLKEEQDSIGEDVRGVYKEADGVGFDKQAIGQLVTEIRKLNKHGEAKIEERSAILDLYRAAYYGNEPSHAHTPAREAKPSKKSPAPQPPAAADGQPSIPTSPAGGAKSEAVAAVSSGGSAEAGSHTAKGEEAVTQFPARPVTPLRPHCQNRDNCGGYGRKHCYMCLKAAGITEAA